MTINSWGPTIQGVLWFSLPRPNTFIALLPPNLSQAHNIPTTLSQKQQLQRRSNTSYPNAIYFSNFTLHKLHWASLASTTTTGSWFSDQTNGLLVLQVLHGNGIWSMMVIHYLGNHLRITRITLNKSMFLKTCVELSATWQLWLSGPDHDEMFCWNPTFIRTSLVKNVL